MDSNLNVLQDTQGLAGKGGVIQPVCQYPIQEKEARLDIFCERWKGTMIEVLSEIAGVVLEVVAREGEDVVEGQEIVILESMKMEIPVAAPQAGRVVRIMVNQGDFVNEGQPVAVLE